MRYAIAPIALLVAACGSKDLPSGAMPPANTPPPTGWVAAGGGDIGFTAYFPMQPDPVHEIQNTPNGIYVARGFKCIIEGGGFVILVLSSNSNLSFGEDLESELDECLLGFADGARLETQNIDRSSAHGFPCRRFRGLRADGSFMDVVIYGRSDGMYSASAAGTAEFLDSAEVKAFFEQFRLN